MGTSIDQCTRFAAHADLNERSVSSKQNIHERVRNIGARLKTYGLHSSINMTTAGFSYTGDGDTVRCDTCKLEVSGWTQDMVPFFVHAERNPKCTFICLRLPKSLLELKDQENPPKRQKTESNSNKCKLNCRLMEVKKLKQIRRRTFSHWSHQIKPSAEQMIVAGFFACNVGDRVICLYCSLICQQWTPDTDDPSEVHKTLSPQCSYVLSMLIHPEQSSSLILNELSTQNVNNQTLGSNNTTQLRFEQIVYTAPCHPAYRDITKRLQSYTTWSDESSPSVDDLVRAGFFYTGTNNVVTCFYCNGSLQNWSANDNPVTEHVRWFGHCSYAKQLCGDELHRQIQEAKRARQERDRANETNQNNNLPVPNNRQLQINDSSVLSRLVAARLDLSISQNLLDQNFKLSVIKRCWEDQLQLKHDDFVSDTNLLICCIILQQQIDCIKGNKDNIIVPSVKMKLIRERKQSGLLSSPALSNDDNIQVLQNQPIPTPSTIESTCTAITTETSKVLETNSSISNPCIICCQEEKRLACIPCGHLTACVSCSHALRTCPICRREIEAFVRIYI